MLSRVYNENVVDHAVRALKRDDSHKDLSKLDEVEVTVPGEESIIFSRLCLDEKEQNAGGLAMQRSDQLNALLKDIKNCFLLVQYSQSNASCFQATFTSAQLHLMNRDVSIPLHYFCGYHCDESGWVNPVTVMRSLLNELLSLHLDCQSLIFDDHVDLRSLNKTLEMAVSASMTDLCKDFEIAISALPKHYVVSCYVDRADLLM